jgi:hypothetical protein
MISYLYKKKLSLPAVRPPPCGIKLRRKISHIPRKLPLPSPPYVGASTTHMRAGSVPRTEPLPGRALACALRMRRGEGVFLTQGEIRSPPGIELGPERCRPELFATTLQARWHDFIFITNKWEIQHDENYLFLVWDLL